MSALIGKTLAIVGDMRLGSKADKDLLAENILKITGRGLFTIDRKHQSHWTGMLLCKLLLISNERPQIKDISGALASRFIIYRTRVSFYGREDPNLFQDKIKPELPGILNWALDGLRRMRARGRLAEPKSSTEERQTLAREGSPVLAFVEECLALDLEADIPKDELHMVYTVWSQKIGLFVKDKAVFMRELEAATGGKITTARPTINGVRVYVVKGARFKNPDDERRHGDADEF
jgi:putative DNA primase/helicase